MMTKRALFILVLAMALALVLPAMAMANYAIHGNYLDDTDACAGCHRAHTSVSTITWTQTVAPGDTFTHTTDTVPGERSALLVTSATNMEEFCYACHDATGQGANTNVQEGVYEADIDYGANEVNTINGDLNGGGFETFQGEPVTSTHVSDGASWGAYGGGYAGQYGLGADGEDPNANLGETVPIQMDCATCHDPHGSANYRILKSAVFDNPVGGYKESANPTDPDPDGWVASTEIGWPVGGFRLHTEYPNYKPSYTEARYAKGYDMLSFSTGDPDDPSGDPEKGMTGWCSGCHATYIANSGNKGFPFNPGDDDPDAPYNAGDGMLLNVRHKHPVNVPLNNYWGPDRINLISRKALITSTPTPEYLPLAHDVDPTEAGINGGQELSDWVECLTCHRAHGTSAQMEGWAAEKADDGNDEIPSFIAPGIGGQPSALLRLDNRGVCEVCHNK